jgi:TrkA domain protein
MSTRDFWSATAERAIRVEEADLPGVGVRLDFLTHRRRRVGVIRHRSGRRDLLVYDAGDPDACSATVPLTSDEADTLAELLGAPLVVERLAALHEQVAGLISEQVTIDKGSPFAGRTLGETRARTRTGASIVAVLRDSQVIASPGPDFRFEPGDSVVVVGTREGIEGVEQILAG